MLTPPPTINTIYRSITNPEYAILVDEVILIEASEDCDAGYLIEARQITKSGEPAHDGLDISADDWAEMVREHQFTAASK